ncbi:MAG: c-type cytochrome [Bdellovibrionota bacterium]
MNKIQETGSTIRRRVFQASFFTSAFILSVMFQNCSVVSSSRDSEEEFSQISQASVLTSKAMSILSSKCARCHNPAAAPSMGTDITDITNVDFLLFKHLVIPGQPDSSDLILSIQEGRMPPDGSPVTVSELDALTKWIQSGLVDESGTVTPPSGSAPLTATFASLNSKIFTARCTGCHNAGNARGGVNLSTYNGVKASTANGVLYASVSNGSMPQGGSRLTAEELARLNEWIKMGAPNN